MWERHRGQQSRPQDVGSGLAAWAGIVTSQVEHSSVLSTCRWLETQSVPVAYASVRSNGLVDLDFRRRDLGAVSCLVSVQWVNNETGVIQPIQEVARLAKRFGAVMHCDATQALGKLHFDEGLAEVDYLTVSGHKIHGPQGCGAIIARDLCSMTPFIHGGDQERGLRGGTENVLGAIGFGAAAQHRRDNFAAITAKLRMLRDLFESRVNALVGEVVVNGQSAPRVVNTTNVGLARLTGPLLLPSLTEAACIAHKARPARIAARSLPTCSAPWVSPKLRHMGASASASQN
ncbi:MAG: aminotransferase class V-fold PLP-dependent enzyme [bacterium]|nr:aminotransferase class V-fold PLP-dependent enzyme [bacterium]